MSHTGDATARARLRDAALALFAERGVDDVSVREIAAAAGVSHGLVRHHFEGKEGLVGAVNDHAVARLRSVLAIASDVDAGAEDLTGVIAARRRHALEELSAAEPGLTRYVARRVTDPDGGGQELFAALADALVEDLEGLRSSGVVREDLDVPMVAGQLLALELGGLLMGEALHSWLGGLAPERWWASLESLLDHGLYRTAGRTEVSPGEPSDPAPDEAPQ